jgi:hypothetical protein
LWPKRQSCRDVADLVLLRRRRRETNTAELSEPAVYGMLEVIAPHCDPAATSTTSYGIRETTGPSNLCAGDTF